MHGEFDWKKKIVVPNSENLEVLISLFEIVKFSVLTSPRNLYFTEKYKRNRNSFRNNYLGALYSNQYHNEHRIC